MAKTRLFFSTDIHGSQRCFLKFVNAGKHYRANVLVYGGDLTGKMIVPIVENGGKYEAEYMGARLRLTEKSDVEELVKKIAATGGYAYRTNQADLEELTQNKSKFESAFERSIEERMQSWISIAEQRLKGTGILCFINPGNDDPYVVDRIIKESSYVVMPEGEVVTLDSQHEMISTGCANLTPWKCPRDVPEEELEKKIDDMASKVKNMRNCVFNFHCPPHGTPLDLAPRLDENLRPILAPGGGIEITHAGSVTVRKAIEKYQPVLGLHGHIHESRGFIEMGRTLCLNPGSEYSEGMLRGAIVDLDDGQRSYLLTEG